MKLFTISPAHHVPAPLIGRVSLSEIANPAERIDTVLLHDTETPPSDLDGYLAVLLTHRSPITYVDAPFARLSPVIDYLSAGDVVYLHPSGYVRVLYRRDSPHNFIFATDRCNSLCLMCSQPPKDVDDSDRISEHLRLVDLIDPATPQLGITGGEPTLLKDDFLRLVEHCKHRLPTTALHVLTNGRMFYYRDFARRLGEIAHPDLMLGIPLYSDVDSEHDFVVQARGAFDETVLGLQHLAEYRVSIEIRVVLHRLTVPRLERLAEFVARNLPFVDHVALMGLEMTGLVHANLSELWIDPFDYQSELRRATEFLRAAGLTVSIYNHQLCVLAPELWQFARRSISDWKNVYLDECDSCDRRDQCGGFFQSGTKRPSAHIRAIRTEVDAVGAGVREQRLEEGRQ